MRESGFFETGKVFMDFGSNPRWDLSQSRLLFESEQFVQIDYSPERGRFLRAKRDLPAGSTLLTSEPLSWIIHEKFKLQVCRVCLEAVEKPFLCMACFQEAYCSPSCLEESRIRFRHSSQCAALRRLDCSELWREANEDMRTNIRFLIGLYFLAALKGPGSTDENIPLCFNENILDGKFITPDSWESILTCVEHCLPPAAVSRRLLSVWLGQLEWNMFGLWPAWAGPENDTPLVQFVNIKPSMINHSCFPNCIIDWECQTCIKVVALRPIRAREEITVSYINAGVSNSKLRQRELQQNYGFKCKCVRCDKTNPTQAAAEEYFQHFLRCPTCKAGLLKLDPTTDEEHKKHKTKVAELRSCAHCTDGFMRRDPTPHPDELFP